VNTPAAGIFNQQFVEPKKLVSFAPVYPIAQAVHF